MGGGKAEKKKSSERNDGEARKAKKAGVHEDKPCLPEHAEGAWFRNILGPTKLSIGQERGFVMQTGWSRRDPRADIGGDRI